MTAGARPARSRTTSRTPSQKPSPQPTCMATSAIGTALRSVQYRYPGENPTGDRSIEVTANDGDADSAGAVKAVTIVSPPI